MNDSLPAGGREVAMVDDAGAMGGELPCHVCGYDLRAHPQEGKCPECEASVAESRRLAAIPRRPAWRDSDPRWRRRVLAGVWILVLVPLMEALKALDWTSRVPVPTIVDYRGVVRSLEDTLVSTPGVWAPVMFCMGMVLLFSRERGRRPSRLDWTRRWGVIGSYVVLLLAATQILFIGALVLVGIAAIFHSMPLEYQPAVTPLLAGVSAGYLRYGAHPMEAAIAVQVASASLTVLLACAALFDALRSSGLRGRLAALLLSPLALFALMHLWQAGRYGLGIGGAASQNVYVHSVYFFPHALVGHLPARPGRWNLMGPVPTWVVIIETAKWCIVLGIAVWLTIAQLAALPKRREAPTAPRPTAGEQRAAEREETYARASRD